MTNNSKEMARIACKALEEKKAEDIRIIDISEVSVIADYFIIADGANPNQLQAMQESVDEALYQSRLYGQTGRRQPAFQLDIDGLQRYYRPYFLKRRQNVL